MFNTTDSCAKTTAGYTFSSIIDTTLSSLKISGSLLLRETYASPWSISIPDSKQLAKLRGIDSNACVVAFHLVEFGHCTVKSESGEEILLKAGEMLICFGGNSHRLFQGKKPKNQPIEALLAGGPNIHSPHATAGAEEASLLCGVFILHQTSFNPLFSALPSAMHASLSRPGEMHNLSGVARLLAEEIDRKPLGGGYVVERLLEVLCAVAIRAYIEALPHQEVSWFQGIKDPIIGQAIATFHKQPGANWSVQRLADDVAMSPSRFAARFSASLGDSPMAYITKWRMNLACQALGNSKQRLEQIASNVGYENQAAFSRAFKKHVGVSPATWRMHQQSLT
jgi:AraC-like DNA-binding protein